MSAAALAGRSCLAEQSGEGVNKAGVGELESCGGELGGVGANAGEQDFVGHFTERQAESECWDGEKCRTVELSGE